MKAFILAQRLCGSKSFHRVDERRQALNPHFELVATLNRPDAARRAGQNNVAGQQGHVCRNKTYKLGWFENHLVCARVLAQLAVLEQLNCQIARINIRFHKRTERCESIE